MQDDEKRNLLFPTWSTNGNGPKYDDLSDVDKRIWRQTRGQRVDADSEMQWLRDLGEATKQGAITTDEARLAIERMGKRHDDNG